MKPSLLLLLVALALLLSLSPSLAQSCVDNSQCPNNFTSCSPSSSTVTPTLPGLAIDEPYQNLYYATKSSTTTTLYKVPTAGAVPPSVYYVFPTSDPNPPTKVLDGLFNYVYYASANTLRKYTNNNSTSAVSTSESFRQQLEIDYSGGNVYMCDQGTNGGYKIDQFGGIQEGVIFPNPTKTVYVIPSPNVCGPSRVAGTALYFSASTTSGSTTTTRFYKGLTTATNGALPTPFFTVNKQVSDFDVSSTYLFFGATDGLFRVALTGAGSVVRVSPDATAITGVRVSSPNSKVFYNNGSAVTSISYTGTNLQTVSTLKSCTCRPGFSGANCSHCNGQIVYNNGVPTCV